MTVLLAGLVTSHSYKNLPSNTAKPILHSTATERPHSATITEWGPPSEINIEFVLKTIAWVFETTVQVRYESNMHAELQYYYCMDYKLCHKRLFLGIRIAHYRHSNHNLISNSSRLKGNKSQNRFNPKSKSKMD